jgi:gliding motility-associated-like protein
MTVDPIPANTNIVRNIEYKLIRSDNKQVIQDLAFSKPESIIAVGYTVVNGQVVAGAPAVQNVSAAGPPSTPDQLSLYWNNGVTWVKVGGSVNLAAQAVQIKSSFLGNYQLRVSQRAPFLSLDAGNVYPRVFTPNGDGFNDRVYFVLENPNNVSVTGEIFDLAGRYVATLQPPTANSGIGTTLIWDGKDSNGSVVPSGAYIYKIQGEGKTFTGSVAVAR